MNSIRAAESDYRRTCSEAGLNCESCTRATAHQLAAICKGLRGKMIAQLFVQIYPNSACAPMHGHFATCYLDASTVHVVSTQPRPLRKESAPARPRAFAAVA
jgi:hypothetical protein